MENWEEEMMAEEEVLPEEEPEAITTMGVMGEMPNMDILKRRCRTIRFCRY